MAQVLRGVGSVDGSVPNCCKYVLGIGLKGGWLSCDRWCHGAGAVRLYRHCRLWCSQLAGSAVCMGVLVFFYGCFLVIEAHGGTWFRTPCPNCPTVQDSRNDAATVYAPRSSTRPAWWSHGRGRVRRVAKRVAKRVAGGDTTSAASTARTAVTRRCWGRRYPVPWLPWPAGGRRGPGRRRS